MATQPPPSRSPSGWATGGLVFAATMLTLVGVFQAIAGLVAIFDDEFYVVTRNYTFDLDVSAWGWLHLLIGIALFATGVGLFQRSAWAGVGAIAVAAVSALANFFFIPYYPIWALVLIAIDLWIIWSVTRPGVLDE